MDLDSFAKLDAHLDNLQAGRCAHIEYGNPDHPGGFLTYLRIHWTPTAGGYQFGIRRLYFGRGESSGEYFPPNQREQLKARLAYLIGQHEKPTPVGERLRKTLRDSKWAIGEQRKITFFEV